MRFLQIPNAHSIDSALMVSPLKISGRLKTFRDREEPLPKVPKAYLRRHVPLDIEINVKKPYKGACVITEFNSCWRTQTS